MMSFPVRFPLDTFVVIAAIAFIFAVLFAVLFFFHPRLRYHLWFAVFAFATSVYIASNIVIMQSGHARTIEAFHTLALAALTAASYVWFRFLRRLLTYGSIGERVWNIASWAFTAVIVLTVPLFFTGAFIKSGIVHADRFVLSRFAGPLYIPLHIFIFTVFAALYAALIVNYYMHRLDKERRFDRLFIVMASPLVLVTGFMVIEMLRHYDVHILIAGYGLVVPVGFIGYWLVFKVMQMYDDLFRSRMSITYFLEKTKNKNREMIETLATTLEMRDKYTAGHSERVRDFAFLIARAINLDNEQKNIINTGCLLHDIGKIGVSEHVLNKPSMLDYAEYQAIKRHVVIGKDMLVYLEDFAPFLDIIYHHHERIDGKGYPEKLHGENIPLLPRIVAVADTFDALTSDRVYRKGMSFEKGANMLLTLRGTQLDGDLVEVFAKKLSAIYSFEIKF
ncbi:MAG: HD-GYP domain-containing protein [Spirochaetes bacterium]|nr:HD-GYP domain-containing protein [Spirochaetota bacterium]